MGQLNSNSEIQQGPSHAGTLHALKSSFPFKSTKRENSELTRIATNDSLSDSYSPLLYTSLFDPISKERLPLLHQLLEAGSYQQIPVMMLGRRFSKFEASLSRTVSSRSVWVSE